MSDGVIIASITALTSVLVAGLAAWSQRKPPADRRKQNRRTIDSAAVEKAKAELESERTAFRNEIRQSLTEQLAQVRAEVDVLRVQLQTVTAERDSLRARVRELEETVMRLQRQADRGAI
jgi:septal ring factor EnvC (AmiA/AmiB activator)